MDETVSFSTWTDELSRVHTLSARERQVFLLLGAGASNRMIATRLCVTERTAKAHVAQIMTKLRVKSRLQAGLVSYALQIIVGSIHVAQQRGACQHTCRLVHIAPDHRVTGRLDVP